MRTIPAYARPIDGVFGEGIRAGVQEALRHFLAEIEAGQAVPRADVYTTLGRGEMRAGRSSATAAIGGRTIAAATGSDGSTRWRR